ncbi:MAG: hypothetical protein KGI08_09420 [Thaumarchaeota archaeon]|nr:hypothetical protein [Nitrososphaerota archaeon]
MIEQLVRKDGKSIDYVSPYAKYLGADDVCSCNHTRNNHDYPDCEYSENSRFIDPGCMIKNCKCDSWSFAHSSRRTQVKSWIKVLGFAFGIMLLLHFGGAALQPIFQPMIDENNQRLELRDQQYDLIHKTQDCFVLKQAQIMFLDDGANADSWFPGEEDGMMKYAKTKADLLGCSK